MMKADVLTTLAAARDAINAAISEANASTEMSIPHGDVVAQTGAADVTISDDGKVVISPPRTTKVLLQDSHNFSKSAYWASAAGSACTRCGGTGRA